MARPFFSAIRDANPAGRGEEAKGGPTHGSGVKPYAPNNGGPGCTTQRDNQCECKCLKMSKAESRVPSVKYRVCGGVKVDRHPEDGLRFSPARPLTSVPSLPSCPLRAPCCFQPHNPIKFIQSIVQLGPPSSNFQIGITGIDIDIDIAISWWYYSKFPHLTWTWTWAAAGMRAIIHRWPSPPPSQFQAKHVSLTQV